MGGAGVGRRGQGGLRGALRGGIPWPQGSSPVAVARRLSGVPSEGGGALLQQALGFRPRALTLQELERGESQVRSERNAL